MRLDLRPIRDARRVLGLNKATLVPLPEWDSSMRFALHPALSSLANPWQAGQLAVLLNAGPLLQPLSRAEFLANPAARPRGLYSHPTSSVNGRRRVAGPHSIRAGEGASPTRSVRSTLPRRYPPCSVWAAATSLPRAARYALCRCRCRGLRPARRR